MTMFIGRHTTIAHAPLVPEIALHLATEITPIWHATEAWLQRENIAPPYWAFAWPGAQVLARHILDNPHLAAGKRVLDFAAGCGLAAIACAKVGAATVEASEIDALSVQAINANARLNDVSIAAILADLVGSPCRWDLILCGDVCYEATMARHIVPWLQSMANIADVLMADPGRAYVPQSGLDGIATYNVPTSLELEDNRERITRLLRVQPLCP